MKIYTEMPFAGTPEDIAAGGWVAYTEAEPQIRKLEAKIARLTERVGDPRADTPANAYWRKRLEIAQAEIGRLRAALENARRDIFGIAPSAGSRSPIRKVAEQAAARIASALANEQSARVNHDYHLRGGPGYDYPCLNPGTVECAFSECQMARRCRLDTSEQSVPEVCPHCSKPRRSGWQCCQGGF